MKSPVDYAKKFEKQWAKPKSRHDILLNGNWPLTLKISRPSGKTIQENSAAVRQHIKDWKNVEFGIVHFNHPLNLPSEWTIDSPSEWLYATGALLSNPSIKNEFETLSSIISKIDEMFFGLIIKNFNTLKNKSEYDIIAACSIALQLEKGIAQGKPLRSLKLNDIDSKFYENNEELLLKLLEIRFPNENFNEGLASFLGAVNHSGQWLLIKDLGDTLQPFKELRVRDKDLLNTPLPAENILIIENEQVIYLLPPLKNTIAILGAGNNLSWMKAEWLNDKNIAYWGDMDTWGMLILNQAKQHQPRLCTLLMNEILFEQYQEESAVKEPTITRAKLDYVSSEEFNFYTFLARQNEGRLEQEFLPEDIVQKTLQSWLDRTNNKK